MICKKCNMEMPVNKIGVTFVYITGMGKVGDIYKCKGCDAEVAGSFGTIHDCRDLLSKPANDYIIHVDQGDE